MKANVADKRPPGRSLFPYVAVLLCLAGALGLYLSRGKGRSPFRARDASEVVRGTYKNRAVVPPQTPQGDDEAPALPAIDGIVYDTEGHTLEGATLVALTYDLAGNLATRVADAASDAAGRFRIPLREGTYQVNVAKEGYGPSTVVVHTGETASVVLPRSGKVKGTVVDDKGRPVRRFTVDIVSAVPGDVPAPPPIWSRRFDSREGAFEVAELPGWPFIVRASSADLAPGFSPALSVRPGETRDVQITLAEGCVLSGKVVDKRGEPLPGVLVNVEERLMAAATADPAIQAASEAVTGDDGRFRIDHVRPGNALVRGYDGDNAPATLAVEIKDCDKIAPVTLVMSPGGGLEGTARRADGTPFPGARVSVLDRSVGIVNTTSDEEGRYSFEDLPAGLLRVTVEHEGRSALSFVQIRDGVTSHLDLALFEEGEGKLEGRVLAGKRPISGARLLVASNRGRAKGIAMYYPVTGADGTFTVPSLPAGAYLVSVMSTSAGVGAQIQKDEVAKVEIDLGAIAAAMNDASRDRPLRSRRARQGTPPDEAASPTP